MQDIRSAMQHVNVAFVGATVAQLGTPYCVAELRNNGNYAWSITPTATVTTMTANLMGSIDGTNWYLLDQMTQADTPGFGYGNNKSTGWSATLGELKWVTGMQVNYLRMDVAVLTGGGSVTGQFSLFEPDR